MLIQNIEIIHLSKILVNTLVIRAWDKNKYSVRNHCLKKNLFPFLSFFVPNYCWKGSELHASIKECYHLESCRWYFIFRSRSLVIWALESILPGIGQPYPNHSPTLGSVFFLIKRDDITHPAFLLGFFQRINESIDHCANIRSCIVLAN